MSGNEAVIDNENVILLDVLKEILPETKRASIAVGYFFISGFAAIMDSIEKIENVSDPNNVVRFLISPTTNRQTAEALLADNETHAEAKKAAEVEGDRDGGGKRAADDLKRMLEYMPQRESDQKAATRLAELIRKGKVQVKGVHEGPAPRKGVHL